MSTSDAISFDACDPMVIVLDAKGRVVQFNASAERVLGYVSANVLGRKFCELVIIPEDSEGFASTITEAVKSGTTTAGVNDWIARNGHAQLVRWAIVPVSHDPETDVVVAGAIPSGGAPSEEMFYQLFHANPHPVMLSKLSDGQIVDVNAGFVQALGYSREEMIGKTSLDVGIWALPEERQKLVQQLCENGAVRGFLIHTKTNTGKIRQFEISVECLRQGEESLLLAIAHDITDQSRIESRLVAVDTQWRNTFDAIEDMVVIIDPDYLVVDANRAMLELVGGEKIVGRSTFDVFHGKLETLANCASLRLFSGSANLHLEVEEPCLGGRWFDIHAYASKDDTGQVKQAVIVARDITQRKSLAGQLRHAQKMEAIGRLAGGVAHDFNNQLTAITGYSELVLSRLTDDSLMRQEVEEIRDAGKRAANLVSQLLAFSRRQILQPARVNINAMLNDMSKILSRVLGEHIELKIEGADDLWSVKADLAQLQQVIINLAVNSRDAMPSGGELTIATANLEIDKTTAVGTGQLTPGPYVTLSVRDTGAGMDDVTRAHLFEPFYTTKEGGNVAGLGLSTVYGIVKQSGGQIMLESALDKGTCVTVYLPRMMEAEEMPVEATDDARSLRGTETILLVEDEDAIRRLAGTILRSHGYRVIEAEGGVEALRVSRLHQGPIHLLLTDVVLPRVSGPSVAERMLDFKPETKVLFMSGYTEESSLLKSILNKKASFLPKPFTPDALATKVREVLDSD